MASIQWLLSTTSEPGVGTSFFLLIPSESFHSPLFQQMAFRDTSANVTALPEGVSALCPVPFSRHPGFISSAVSVG